MCRSKADGGRRCSPSITYRALRKIRRNGDQRAEQKLLAARAVYGPIVTPGEIPVPPEVTEVMEDLSVIGRPLVVGGSVRDSLLGATPKDFDIEVYGTSLDDIEAHLRAKGYRVDSVGKAFGVIKAQRRRNEEPIDISVPRRDSLNEGEVGHRAFTVAQDSELDVVEASARRDFTMNAVMYDHARGVFIDPHGGIEDLKAGVLRHVSDAFGEDPLRPLRAFQFAGRFNLTVDEETAEVCRNLRPRLTEIPKERIRGEWDKFYRKSASPRAAMQALYDMGWEDSIPGSETVDLDALERASETGPVMLGAVFSRNMSDADAREFTKLTIEGGQVSKQAYYLSRATPPETLSRNTLRKWARELGKRGLTIQDWAAREDVFADTTSHRREVVEKSRSLGIYDAPPSDLLHGRDVIPLTSRKPGPWVGALLAEATDAQDQGLFTTSEEANAWLRNKLSNHSNAL